LIYSAEVAGETGGQNVVPQDFFDVAKMYFMCDVGAYTKDAGGVESLDYMFKFTPRKMDFSPAFKKRMDDLEVALKKLDIGSDSPSVAVYHGTSGKYLANIIKEGLKAKKYHNFSPGLYKGERNKDVFVTTNVLDAQFFAGIATRDDRPVTGPEIDPKTAVILKLLIPKDEFKKAEIDAEWGSTAFMLPEVKPEWIEKVAAVEPVIRRDQEELATALQKIWGKREPKRTMWETGISEKLLTMRGTTATRNAKMFDTLYDTIWEKIKKALGEQFKIVYLPMSFANWLKIKEKLN
jgi:hypothetical protein